METLRTLASHRINHILFAFLGMGGWAVWANRMHDMPAPLIAGVVQGMISASLTVVMQTLILTLLRRTGSTAIAILCASLMSLATLLLIHTAAGTPEVLLTIVLPWCIGISYAVLFTLSSAKKARA